MKDEVMSVTKDLSDRTKQFALRIIKMFRALPNCS